MAQPEATYKGIVTTFRQPGTTAVGLEFLALWNGSGTKDMAIREVVLHQDFAGASGTRRDVHLAWLDEAATAGTVLDKVPVDTALSSDANVVFRGGASADGTATAITSVISFSIWKAWGQIDPSAVGQMLMEQHRLWPLDLVELPILVPPQRGLIVYNPVAGSTSSHYMVSIRWEEFNRLRGGKIRTVAQAVNRAASF